MSQQKENHSPNLNRPAGILKKGAAADFSNKQRRSVKFGQNTIRNIPSRKDLLREELGVDKKTSGKISKAKKSNCSLALLNAVEEEFKSLSPQTSIKASHDEQVKDTILLQDISYALLSLAKAEGKSSLSKPSMNLLSSLRSGETLDSSSDEEDCSAVKSFGN